ncbi:MAG: acylphosphatase [Patescibacteria group bacterium]|nr:acylphosphatase [Patescibacteria group bacterium]
MVKNARAHIYVSGKVQMVFFRASVLKKAISFGLKGFVRNTFDNKVEAVFEGEKKKIEEIINWSKIGPRLSVVKKVDVFWEGYQNEFKDFKINS